MRIMRSIARGLVAVLALAAAAGCENEVPTATGESFFPGGTLPTTIEVLLPAEQFLVDDTVFDGYADARRSPFLLAANAFDGALFAHSLVRFTDFPDSVSFVNGGATVNDTAFAYTGGRVFATVNQGASTSPVPARLRLYALEQAWDSATVTWEVAGDTIGAGGGVVRWRTPGGTRGELLAEALWTPGTTAAADSLIWQVDSLAVRRMAARGFPGLVVTSETPGSRVQFSGLTLEARIRPAARADTTLTRTVSEGPQTLIFTPPVPLPLDTLVVGGVTGARSRLRLDLSRPVPACANPATTPSCPTVPLREVTLNRAELLLQPVAVPLGFRPLRQSYLRVRRVLEPELGRRAPLGETLALDSVPAARFAAPGAEPVALNLTNAVVQLASGTAATSVTLLSEPEGGQFGYLWFAPRPRLRLVYTLPLRPRLP